MTFKNVFFHSFFFKKLFYFLSNFLIYLYCVIWVYLSDAFIIIIIIFFPLFREIIVNRQFRGRLSSGVLLETGSEGKQLGAFQLGFERLFVNIYPSFISSDTDSACQG